MAGQPHLIKVERVLIEGVKHGHRRGIQGEASIELPQAGPWSGLLSARRNKKLDTPKYTKAGERFNLA